MMNKTQSKQIQIVKASGETEPFAESKLRNSLKKAGASEEAADVVVQDIIGRLHEGMTTKDIYSRAFSHLRRKERPTAGRYHLRMALMEVEPTGRPFERFVGELLKSEGFDVEVARIVHGVCVKHEVDVVCTKSDRHIMVECKFHNKPGLRSDVKISLYVQARFEDVEREWKKQSQHGEKFHEVWLVTNTKFTSDATDYAACVGMHAIGWNYPLQNGLEAHIEKNGLHPITCLTTLSKSHKRELVEKDILTCKQLFADLKVLQSVGVSEPKTSSVADEIKNLCHLI